MNRTLAQRRSCMSCVRYLLVVTNCMLIIIALAIAGVFLWMAVDQVDSVKGVIGTDLVLASVCLLIAAGILLLFVSCFGVAAASVENLKMMIVYAVTIVIIMLAFVSASICIAVFTRWLNEDVRRNMEYNLKYVYGVNLDNPWNLQVTKSWDKAQAQWHCCAAADKSWAVYQESKWYALSVGVEGFGRPFVPESCCERGVDGKVKNLNVCLYTRPPAIGDQYSGNPAPVYYRGCYETVKDFLLDNEVSWFTGIFWVGIAGAILMLYVLILSISMCVQINRSNNDSKIRENELEFLSKSSSQFIVNNNNNNNSNNSHDRSLALRQTAPNQYMYSMA